MDTTAMMLALTLSGSRIGSPIEFLISLLCLLVTSFELSASIFSYPFISLIQATIERD
jgi:hypothetical protein